MVEDPHFDVLVVGDGPAGCASAIELAGNGARVAMLARGNAGRQGHAAEILAPEIEPLLSRLGVRRAFHRHSNQRCFGLQSSWGGAESMSYMASPWGNGWHVDRQHLDTLLVSQAAHSGVAVFRDRRIGPLHRAASGWRVVLRNETAGRRIRADFIIDASGRTSRLRAALGARTHVHDRLVGLGCWFRVTENEPTTWLEADEQGWWYSAPGTDDVQRFALFMTDIDLLRRGMRQSSDYWRARLDESTDVRSAMRTAAPIAAPRTYLAYSQQVIDTGQSRWLPAGDALQSTDPLSGRGVVIAVQSGLDAAAAALQVLAGAPGAAQHYLDNSVQSFHQYLHERLEIYGREGRWRNALFWRRREQRR